MGPQTHLFIASLIIILSLFFYDYCDCKSTSSKQHKRVSYQKEISVDDFGAKADGKTDDSKAFKQAWKEACSKKAEAETETVLVVPVNKTYLLTPNKFSGPCKSKNITMKIYGTIEASTKLSDFKKERGQWLEFENIQNLKVEGDGTINGNGEIWWKNSCKVDKSKVTLTYFKTITQSKISDFDELELINSSHYSVICSLAHTRQRLTFSKCNNLIVRNLTMKDAPQMHLVFKDCVNVEALFLGITAPEKSPNTDGIHVTDTQNIKILNSVIQTGDDCISIVSGSKNIQAENITCGPGHGISIGSLGKGKSEAQVSDVFVNGANLNGTTNGVRIKTWQGGSGTATNITFQNITMYNVENPIIIDQNYCDQDSPCKGQESAVKISDVLYNNIKGTSASKIAVKLDCSEQHPCQGIVLQDINLVRAEDDEEEAAKASCNNVKWTKVGEVVPCCTSSLKESLGIVRDITILESN